MTPRTHHDLIRTIVTLVDDEGSASALATLRAERPALRDGHYHDTLAVFWVWAVDRLLAGGLRPTAVLWHPLVHADSPLAWWSAALLDTRYAAERFVPVPDGLPGEPLPVEPAPVLAAA